MGFRLSYFKVNNFGIFVNHNSSVTKIRCSISFMLESKYKTYQAHDYIIFYSFSILLILIYTVALITALYLQQFKLTHAEVFRKNKHGKKMD